jgi:GlpG protein
VLGHSGWDHLVGNLSYILLLGPLLEEKYGSRTLLAVIAVTAAITGILNYVLFPRIALCGASGVVFAFILLSSVTSIRTGEIPLTFILVAVIYLGQQVIQGVFVADNISNLSHFAGGVIGGAAGFKLGGGEKDAG